MPSFMVSFFGKIKRLFDTFVSLIPDMPSLDIRSRMALLSLGVPLVLDVLFIWFLRPFWLILIHMFDYIFIFGLGYSISVLVMGQIGTTIIMVFVLCVLYLGLRFKYRGKEENEQSISINDFARDICNHFMAGIIPGVKENRTMEEIDQNLNHFSDLIKIIAKPSGVWKFIGVFVVGISVLALSYYFNNIVYMTGVTIPGTVEIFFPYFGYPIGFMLVVLSILKATKCGSDFILSVKHFSKRWGLKVLMLSLDLLYIPIIAVFVSMITPKKMSCEYGNYHAIGYNTSITFDLLVNHSAKCTPCNESLWNSSTYCIKECNAIGQFRMIDDKSLLFYEDVLLISGGSILFTILFVGFGIPVLWSILILQNRKFVNSVNIYGKDINEKWLSIVTRMKSTGIFLFANFKPTVPIWSIVLIFAKFFIMTFSTIGSRLWGPGLYFLPFFHLSIFVSTWIIQPYIYTINNILDICLYFINFIMASIPVLGMHGVSVPKYITVGLSFCIFFIPISIIIITLKRVCSSAQIENDPTVIIVISEDERQKRLEEIKLVKEKEKHKGRRKRRRTVKSESIRVDDDPNTNTEAERRRRLIEERKHKRQKERHRRKRHTKKEEDYFLLEDFDENEEIKPKETLDDEDDIFHIREQEEEIPNPNPTKTTRQSEQARIMGLFEGALNIIRDDIRSPLVGRDPKEEPTIGELWQINDEKITKDEVLSTDDIVLEKFHLESLEELAKTYKPSIVSPLEEPTAPFSVNPHLLASRFSQMLQVLDAVLDGSTIETLTKALNYAVLFGAIAFGWFVGGITESYKSNVRNYCS